MNTPTNKGILPLQAIQLEKVAYSIAVEVQRFGFLHGESAGKEFFERLGRKVAFTCLPPEVLKELLLSNTEVSHGDSHCDH